MKSLIQAVCCLVALSIFATRSHAGEINQDAPPPLAPAPNKNGTPASGVKDPTQLSPRMREMLAPKPEQRAPEAVKAPTPKLPEIVLRGLVTGKDSQGSAALGLKGGSTVLVRAGSSFSALSDNQTLLVVVRSISSEAIVLEIPELQQTLTIR